MASSRQEGPLGGILPGRNRELMVWEVRRRRVDTAGRGVLSAKAGNGVEDEYDGSGLLGWQSDVCVCTNE
ncbi:hypothetical protein Tdes44962_MAKER07904 [Teratosphaeria destructans]|uniref:Uncharacterized protein n=1 Tax=Teratosphaeria destructans TaxID=418781 RepID=A0A9W7W593_9PEZI|nr:hypothetical protein Tdes44962_MAKER07904 [Teratosphaeria destructans]